MSLNVLYILPMNDGSQRPWCVWSEGVLEISHPTTEFIKACSGILQDVTARRDVRLHS